MKMVLFFSVLIMALFYQRAEIKAEFPPCGCYPQYRTQKIYDIVNGNRDTLIAMNQDSSMVLDTCYIDAPHTIACGDKIRYMKNLYGVYDNDKFYLTFKDLAIKSDSLPKDSIKYYYWQDIDTNMTQLRNSFQKIEENFGAFKFRKLYSKIKDHQMFIMYFEHRVNVGKLYDSISIIQNVLFSYNQEWINYSSITEDISGNKKYTVKLYNNQLMITDNNGEVNDLFIKIFDINGNIILQNSKGFFSNYSKIEINIDKFNAGIYFIQINNEYHKLIKF